MTDVTSGSGVLAVMGPRMPGRCSGASATPTSPTRPFPFGTCQRHRHRLRARTGDAGLLRGRAGLGAAHRDRVRRADLRPTHGGRRRPRASGSAASTRWIRSGARRATATGGHDITQAETPLEAGLGFAVSFRKDSRLHRPRGAGAPAGGGAHRQRLVARDAGVCPSPSCSTTRRSTWTAGSPAASLLRRSATASSGRLAWATC